MQYSKYSKWGVMTKHTDNRYKLEFYASKRQAKVMFNFFSKEIYPVLIKRKIRNDCIVEEVENV